MPLILSSPIDKLNSRNDTRAVAQIIFSCPVTGGEVPSGIETEAASVEQLAPEEITLVCPQCGRPHTWQIRQGHLSDILPEAR